MLVVMMLMVMMMVMMLVTVVMQMLMGMGMLMVMGMFMVVLMGMGMTVMGMLVSMGMGMLVAVSAAMVLRNVHIRRKPPGGIKNYGFSSSHDFPHGRKTSPRGACGDILFPDIIGAPKHRLEYSYEHRTKME